MRIGLDGNAEAASKQGTTVSPKLQNAAREFEALMMKELLKPMTAQSSLAGDAGESGGSTGALGEFASEALAQAISRHGGFGIADRILGELSHSGHSSEIGKTSEHAQRNSSMRLSQ